LEVFESLVSSLPLNLIKGSNDGKRKILSTLQGPFGYISMGIRLTSEKQIINSFNPM
jgi:hypothetical protein